MREKIRFYNHCIYSRLDRHTLFFTSFYFFFQACFLYVRAASMLNSRANPPSAA